jgi:hypothetical protein
MLLLVTSCAAFEINMKFSSKIPKSTLDDAHDLKANIATANLATLKYKECIITNLDKKETKAAADSKCAGLLSVVKEDDMKEAVSIRARQDVKKYKAAEKIDQTVTKTNSTDRHLLA